MRDSEAPESRSPAGEPRAEAASAIDPPGARSLLLRNFGWNLGGRAWQIVLTLASVPLLIDRLGLELYGVYALVSVFLGYFRFLDFGFSTALERFGAKAIARGDRPTLRRYFRTAATAQGAISVFGGLAVLALAHWFVPLLEAPPAMRAEVIDSLGWIAATFTLTLASGVPAGLLRAAQRFDHLNRIGVVTGTLSTVLLVIVALAAPALRWVILTMAAASAVGFVWTLVAATRSTGLSVWPGLDRQSLRELIGFGGFVTIGGLVTPVLVNLEKIMLGTAVGVATVSHYMVPYRALERITVLPGSVSRAIFPHLSSLHGKGDDASIERTHLRSTELVLWMVLPLFAGLWIAGPALFTLWMGEEFAQVASPVLLILSAGWFVNMLAWNAVVLIQACGHPGRIAALYVAEAAVYLPLAWLATVHFGLVGAAVAWSARVIVDAVVLWLLASLEFGSRRARLPGFDPRPLGFAALLIAGSLVAERAASLPTWGAILLGTAAASTLAGVAWWWVLTHADRDSILDKLPWIGRGSRTPA